MSLSNAALEEVVVWIAIGIVAGWLASKIMGSRRGIIEYALLGIVGAIVGGFVFSVLEIGGASNILGQIAIATVGAILVLAIVGR
jgi:uncharacterized membrane protein YeaQ/YmgE (transglycosylase-associated protein family)